jgi:predicted hydrolase (HD superfamily)
MKRRKAVAGRYHRQVLGRFELFLALRNQVADRGRVRRALAVEAVMEELATALGHDPGLWGLAGLGADIDVELTAQNPDRRGAVAEELLLTEGVPPDAAVAARLFRDAAVASLPPLVQGLVVADAAVDIVADLSEHDERLAMAVAHGFRRLEKQGQPRPTQALQALGLEPLTASELTLRAHEKAGL